MEFSRSSLGGMSVRKKERNLIICAQCAECFSKWFFDVLKTCVSDCVIVGLGSKKGAIL